MEGVAYASCIQQSAPDGYYRNQDCRLLNLFVCEVDKNVAFTQPPEGRIWGVIKLISVKVHYFEILFGTLAGH